MARRVSAKRGTATIRLLRLPTIACLEKCKEMISQSAEFNSEVSGFLQI
jgi:hypothetical protein